MVDEGRSRLISPRTVSGLAELADGYDLILCDVWGVLHNGTIAFPAASDALVRARAKGARVMLISNAPRPGPFVLSMLDNYGVPRTAYDGIVTSGDVTRTVLETHGSARVYHLGPERDLNTYDGLPLVLGGQAEAEIVVCTGLFDDEVETPANYVRQLSDMKAAGLLFVCANPDIVVERGDKLIYCAGALAKLYEELGGEVIYCGKPYRPIYEEALRRAAASGGTAPAADRVLCIGDALHTDIIGAARSGFDSLFIASGIHAAELKAEGGAVPDPEALANLFTGHSHPRGVMPRLAW